MDTIEATPTGNIANLSIEMDKARHNATLITALQEAQILLAYAAQHGDLVEENVIKTIVTSVTLHANAALSDADETAFWIAFNALTKASSPVTADSLESIYDSNVAGISKKSLARQTVILYQAFAILTLCLLLIAQIYWLFGTKLIEDVYSVRTEQTKPQMTDQAKQQSAQTDVVVTQGTDTESYKQSLQRQNQLTMELRSASLKSWCNWWLPYCDNKKVLSKQAEDSEHENLANFLTSKLMIEVLQIYLLPLLYGALGSCVYILRTLASEIAACTYSRTMNIGFTIRFFLGTLAGMVIAWFVTPDTSGGLFKSLSPFALAFLAGYNVEILFSLMDRFLMAFTNKKSGE